ncbi:lithocholate 6-beta-hydroxylase [Nephila pilipes]|uniref:Lithocholate 6-beta-hydroxylase n=1 Tax=Nephila pilipes TaxID=299642 RepID=A0A8X6MZH8_NEPPI|nr:lithocholate 6-beta-hydroxylase [Nephila pilipes]
MQNVLAACQLTEGEKHTGNSVDLGNGVKMFVDIYYACVIVLILFFLSFVRWYLARNDDYWIKRGIPSTPREGYITMIYKLSTSDMAEFIKNLTKKYGRVVGSFEGSSPSVTVAEPDLLRDILVKDFHIFPYRNVSVLILSID